MKKFFQKKILFLSLLGIMALGVFSFFSQAHAYETLANYYTIVTPNGGEERHGTQNITWTPTGGGNVDIAYCEGINCSVYTTIVSDIANSGSYSWDTTTASGDSTRYKILVQTHGGLSRGESADYFTIDNTDPTLSFTNNVAAGPTTYDTISANWGDATTTLWTYDADGTCPTSSEEYDYDSEDGMSQANEANNGKYICLYGEDDAGNYATLASANDINIDVTDPYVPNTTLTSPNDSEYMSGGQTFTITWNSGVIVDTGGLGATAITLKYTTNGGSSWADITSNEPNDGEYEWTVPTIDANSVIMSIAVADSVGNGGRGSDHSYDNNYRPFTIDSTKPTVYSLDAIPNPASGTVHVTIVFTEVGGMDTGASLNVLLKDGSDNTIVGDWISPTIWTGTIDVSGLTEGTAVFSVTGATDLAGNIMDDDTNAGTLYIDRTGPTYTINNGTEAGPVKNDVINVTLNDIDGVSSAQYGFSADSTCDGSDTYGNSFSSATNFTIAGNHTDYLCFKTIDNIGNISYTGGFLLNTDNTAPSAPVVSTGVTTPGTGTTPTIGITTTEASGHIHVYSGADFYLNITPINSGDDTIPLYYDPLVEGVHSEFSITFVDYAGNESSATSVDSFTIDLTNPVVNSLFSNSFVTYTNDTTPTFVGNVTDNLTNIVSVEYSLDEGDTRTGADALDESFNSTSEDYTLTTDALTDGERYITIRTTDSVGHVSSTTGRTFYVDTQSPTVAFNIPTDASTTMNIAGNAINTGASPISQIEYFIDTVGSDDAGTDLTLATGTTTRNFNGSIDLSELDNGTHILYVHAKSEAGERGPTVYDSFNVNSEAPDITSLYMSNVAGDTATINWTSNVTPDTAEYRIKLNNGQFGSWNELNAPHDLATLNVNKTYIIEIRLGIGDNYTTDTITFTTAGATDGIIVDSLTRILNGSTPTAGGGYASGYHYRFNLTINDILMDTLNFKLADWSNSATTMAVANNTKIFVSTNGIDDADYEPLSPAIDSTTLTGSNVYSSDLTIDGIDANSSKGGNQVTLDMFYKIPTGAQGIFSTSYGVRVSNTGD